MLAAFVVTVKPLSSFSHACLLVAFMTTSRWKKVASLGRLFADNYPCVSAAELRERCSRCSSSRSQPYSCRTWVIPLNTSFLPCNFRTHFRAAWVVSFSSKSSLLRRAANGMEDTSRESLQWRPNDTGPLMGNRYHIGTLGVVNDESILGILYPLVSRLFDTYEVLYEN